MAANQTMLQNIRNRCGNLVKDVPEDVLTAFLDSALTEFFPNATGFSSIGRYEQDVCVLRACEMACHRAAADYVAAFKFQSPDFEGDPSTVTQSALALAKAFRKELDQKLVSIGGGRAGVKTALMFTHEPRYGTEPMSVNSPPVTAPVLTSLGQTAEGWELSWTKSSDTTFSSYSVYIAEGSSVLSDVQKDDFRPAVASGARRALTSRDRNRTSALVNNITSGTTYTAVVIVAGNSGVYGYSNEVTLTAT